MNHIAIIMDGNGRWAQERKRPRVWGHIRGVRTVSQIVEAASDLKVKALTLYAFSTENWSRPELEVSTLFKLLKKFLIIERPRILKNKIKFKIIGDVSRLPVETKKLIFDLENETKNFPGLKLSFAFDYGGRDEIIRAVNSFISQYPGQILTPQKFSALLDAPESGDVDLLIRTGGDQRISNFLLWQSAYAELWFTQTKWPDFNVLEFKNIIEQAAKRERRFGSVTSADSFERIASLSAHLKSQHPRVVL